MGRTRQTPQVPGATPPPAPEAPAFPTFQELRDQKILEIAKLADNLDVADQGALDALDEDTKAKLLGYYERFRQAPPDPTPAQIQEGADQVTDVAIAMSKGAAPTAGENELDPTKLDRPMLTKDGWVCPAKSDSLKKPG